MAPGALDRLFEWLAAHRGRLAAGDEPARRGGDGRQRDDDERKIHPRHARQRVKVAAVPRHERGVRTGGSQDGSEQRERTGGRAGDRASGPPARAGRGERAACRGRLRCG